MTPDELRRLLDVPFTFDMLRDESWQPAREDYRVARDAAQKLARDHADLREWAATTHRWVNDALFALDHARESEIVQRGETLLAEYAERWGNT